MGVIMVLPTGYIRVNGVLVRTAPIGSIGDDRDWYELIGLITTRHKQEDTP
jgi:hypothetical protein